MPKLLPPMDDLPMSLGDHLDELRRRLIWPLVVMGLAFFIAFAYEARLQQLFVQPLEWAIQLSPENAEKVGFHSPVHLQALEVTEAPMASMLVSFYTAFFVSFPFLVYHLWMFIGVGLVQRERRLAFLFVPAGIMFFYAGVVLGFFQGLPYFYSFMIKWAANNPIIEFKPQLRSYHTNFVFMTIIFGLVADIPWLIMVLVRVGFVTVGQLISNWKFAILINTVIAAVVAPPDAVSMLAMMVPLFGLYALGIGLSKLMMWHHGRQDAKEQADELARMAEEEAAAHRAQAPHDGHAVSDPHAEAGHDVAPSTPAPVEDHLDPQPVPRPPSITDDLASHSDSIDHDETTSSPVEPPAPVEPSTGVANDAAGGHPADGPTTPGTPDATPPHKDDDRG